MAKIERGPNWEDDLGGEFASRGRDVNFEGVQREVCARFEQSFMVYLPRLCEHCLNPTCVAACPSGSIYKREEDGIVLIDQDNCKGWRMCVPACPYKKIYYNYGTGKSEKCTLCYPRLEAGEPTVCSETCVGRIRYLGVVLYDADRIGAAASVESEQDLYEAQLQVMLDPCDPAVEAAALASGIHPEWIDAARRSPVYKLAAQWKLAFPLHPEFRTLPMVWYVPPLSPIQDAADHGFVGFDGSIPDVSSLQIPMRYLANLLTAGKTEPIEQALRRMFAMRIFMRSRHVDGADDPSVLAEVGLSVADVEEMYRYLALARIEDRFVIPTARRETSAAALQGACGISTEAMGGGASPQSPAPVPDPERAGALLGMQLYQALGWLLAYPEREWLESLPELEAVVSADDRLEPPRRTALRTLLRELRELPLLALQERYVSLFDRSASLSLHLFEHVHGESRARGAAMAQLAELYARAELCVEAAELPDYLPLVCEFLALAPPAQRQALLADAAAVIARLESRLAQRRSAYAAVLGALHALAGAGAEQAAAERGAEREPNPFVAADRDWTEEEVVFGPLDSSGASAEVVP